MIQRTSAAIIGAGLTGLGAIGTLKEEGFERITCFEKTGYLGGLWRYHDDDTDGIASVMKTTTINTSKEMGAFSNFPPAAEYPNYMHNSLMYKYIKSFAKHIGAEECIKFFHEVQKVEKADDYEETGRWKITCRNTETGEIINEVFDCISVCIGHHVYPNIPSFPGQEYFSGKIMHSHSLKKSEGFEDMRVVVVGVGNSGVDAAVKLSSVAQQVYLSSRRGAWVFPKMVPHGLPSDLGLIRRCNYFAYKLLPYSITCYLLESFVNIYLDHSVYSLKPKHSIISQHPTVSDSLPIKLLSGAVVIRGNIKTFTENGVVFDGEESETPVDAVILCTGYKVKFSFLSEDILPVKDNRVKLYKFIFPPDLPHPTLAILGQIQSTGPIVQVNEMQCRWACRIMSGKLSLSSGEKMYSDIKKKDDYNRWRYIDSTRHTFQVDIIEYPDELAEEIGCKPNFLKLAITDPKLFYCVIFGPMLPYQYRLQGPYAWDGARDAIFTYWKRFKTPLMGSGQDLQKKENCTFKFGIVFKILFLLPLILYLFMTIVHYVGF